MIQREKVKQYRINEKIRDEIQRQGQAIIKNRTCS